MYKDGKTDIEVRQGLANIFYSKEEKWGKKQKKLGIFFKNGKNQHLSERESEQWYCSGDQKLPWTLHKWPRHANNDRFQPTQFSMPNV